MTLEYKIRRHVYFTVDKLTATKWTFKMVTKAYQVG